MAIQLDINGEIEAASEAYEVIIAEGTAPIDAYINLACLYWVHSQFGSPMSNEFRVYAGECIYEVLEQARNKFGYIPEVEFWELYFNQITLGESIFLQRAKELVADGSTLIPYFYIYAESKQREQYTPFIKELRQQVESQPTEKNRYILSYLNSNYFKSLS